MGLTAGSPRNSLTSGLALERGQQDARLTVRQ